MYGRTLPASIGIYPLPGVIESRYIVTRFVQVNTTLKQSGNIMWSGWFLIIPLWEKSELSRNVRMQEIHDEETAGSPVSFFHMQWKSGICTHCVIFKNADEIECTENLRCKTFPHCTPNLRCDFFTDLVRNSTDFVNLSGVPRVMQIDYDGARSGQ